MSETLASIKASIKSSAPDYILPTQLSRRSDPLQYSIESYSGARVSKTIETTHNRDKVVREVVTTERIGPANNKIINIRTYDATTNTINKAIEHFDSNNNMTKRVVKSFSYDPVKKAVQLGETVVVKQSFDAKNNITHRAEQKFNAAGKITHNVIDTYPNVNITNNLRSDICQLTNSINSFPTKESTPVPVEATIGNHLNLGLRNLVPVMNYASRL
ncbi:hypothetical protein [Yersinia intermedia]|uniref:hypothetical protein n=1 Tax=Yersinia intermedia TaxID=631 RepID=UPI0011A19EF2|nr:hypothetical protein [Yersinia intermedia]